MDLYPPELVTPPLSLVALLGCGELHNTVGEYLRQHRPPVNSIGLAEPQSAIRFFGERKTSVTNQNLPAEILKADWFAKHRQRRPAVAVLFLSRQAVTGDPASWARCTAQVDAAKAATQAGGGRVVIVVAQAADTVELPEENALLLCRQAGIDRRCLLALCLSEPAGLAKLGRTLHEQSGVYYLDEARRVLSLHAERRTPPPELNARTSFKAAALAEFRADWSTAVKTYQTAYSQVQKVALGSLLPYQHWHELTAVAEQVHIKVVTLLLHQHRSQEALTHFQQHLATYRQVPPQLVPTPAPAGASHWGWVARQYQVMGELMSSRVDPAHLPPQRDCHPAYFFLCAATAYTEQRREVQRIREARTPTQGSRSLVPPEVGPGRGVGQVVVPNLQGGRRLTDPEFLAWLEEQQLLAAPAKVAILMLTTAHELYKKSPQPASRLMYHIGALMAREHLASEDAQSAHKLLQSVAVIYRKERWGVPLAAALLELRECANRQHKDKEHIEYSLELACQQQYLGEPQRVAICQAAIRALQGSSPAPAPASPPLPAPETSEIAAASRQLQIQSPDSGLFFCFALHVALAPSGAPPSLQGPTQACFGVALWSNLPVLVTISRLEAVFSDRKGFYHQALTPQAPAQPDPLHKDDLQQTGPDDQQKRPAQQIQPQQWNNSFACWPPRHSGKLKLQAVVAYIGNSSITWEVEAFPSDQWPWGQTDGSLQAAQNPFVHTALAGALGRQQLEVPLQHAPPQFQVKGAGFAMVGEDVPMTVAIHAADPLCQAQLVVGARYLEGGGHSDLPVFTSLSADRQPLQGLVQLPDLAAGQDHQIGMYVPVSRQGQIHFSAKLQYCMPQDVEETAHQAAGLEVIVEQPFSTDFRFSAAPRVQSIMPPASDPPQAPPVGLAQPRGAPRRGAVLPLGEPATTVACLTAAAPCEIRIHNIRVEHSSQASHAEVVSIQALLSQQPVGLRKGDRHTCVLQVRASQAGQDMPLGHLAVTWARTRGGEGQEGGQPGQQITTRLPLPSVSFERPLLQAQLIHASEAQAGAPFTIKVVLQSQCALLQSLEVSVKDSAGFVSSGPKHTSVSVLPFQSTALVWQMVAYTSGYLNLPNIELVSKQHSVLLSACHGRQVHVLPAKLPKQVEAQAQSSSPFSGPIDNLANSVSQLAMGQSQLVA